VLSSDVPVKITINCSLGGGARVSCDFCSLSSRECLRCGNERRADLALSRDWLCRADMTILIVSLLFLRTSLLFRRYCLQDFSKSNSLE
jgi:hypothetical protein